MEHPPASTSASASNFSEAAPPPPPQVALFQIITGFLPARLVWVAAELGIADLLGAGGDPRPVAELARETGVEPDALYRVLRALASIGIFAETGHGRFALTPMAELLRSDHPSRMRAVSRMIAREVEGPAQDILHSVRTGGPALEKVCGAPIFDVLSRDPQRAAEFDAAMTGIHGPETAPIIEAGDFPRFGTIVDVGGGNGSMLIEILRAAPRARGIVFDLPGVAQRTRDAIAAAELGGRCEVRGGSFFESVPAGGDAYLLRHIIHDWDDEKSALILQRCREALAPGGRVLIIESVIPEGNTPHPGKWLDIVMLLAPGGRERTAAEYEALLRRAGLRPVRVVPTASPVSIVEAERA